MDREQLLKQETDKIIELGRAHGSIGEDDIMARLEHLGASAEDLEGVFNALAAANITVVPAKEDDIDTIIEGNFDDAQSGVKRLFQSDMAKQLKEKEHVVLSSANSINIGRLIPQIVYYFSAYRQLLEKNEIAMGDKVSFCVPTGNFGNVLAGYYAKLMGLPVAHLVVAANENKVLDDFLRSGVYDRNRPFHTTISPSMDILISSNLERLLFELADRNAVRVQMRMDKLAQEGVYNLYDEELEQLQELLWADSCGEDETVETIYEFFEEYQYPMDTHTACAMYAAGNYIAQHEKDGAPMVIVSTASPYKFPQDVMYAITGNDIKDSFKAIKHLNIATAMKVPASLSKLRDKSARFTTVADKDKLYAEVLKFVDKK